jgi:hypothetical protein
LECVRPLWGDADFAPYLFVVPEKHYVDKGKKIRMYHNMHTGKWWWSTQAGTGLTITVPQADNFLGPFTLFTRSL